VREELAQRDWPEEDLAQRSKGEAGKVDLDRRLRAETTMTLAWLAPRVKMGV
jgi:hypothetical protein